jgi:hypothetical protein
MFAKRGFIGLSQPHLADRRSCLEVVHGLRAARPSEALHAGGDGAGGDEEHLATFLAKPSDLMGAVGYETLIESGAVVGNECATYLYNQALTLSYLRSHEAELVLDSVPDVP